MLTTIHSNSCEATYRRMVSLCKMRQAYAFVKCGAILLGVIPCLLVFPLLAPVVVFLAVMIYFKETRKADEKLRYLIY